MRTARNHTISLLNSRGIKVLALLAGLLVWTIPLAAADLPSRQIPDDASFRTTLVESWFTEVPVKVLSNRPFMYTLPGGGRIEVRSEEGGAEFMVILARELNGTFPGWAQGSWILTRRKDDGSATRIRFFPRSDPYTYVQFRPLADKRSLMDVVLYDAYVVQAQPIPLSFDRLLLTPVEEVFRVAGTSFPRRYFEPHSDGYQDIRSLISQMRAFLPGLRYRDDGAIDEKGRYVFINTLQVQEGQGGLNCSGFAKWVVDGILWPLTEGYLPIEPLKLPFGDRGSSFTRPYETLRDPFFGLDWTRNLAARANEVLRSAAYTNIEEIEVRKVPFGSVIIRGNGTTTVKPYPGFLLNAGVGFEGLQPLLYTLAIDEPGRIYLASVNQERGSSPPLREHFHVAVLIPYFNEFGNFQIAVFESAAETSFAQFRGRYGGHYVNLVRIPVEGMFKPQTDGETAPPGTPRTSPGQTLFFYGIKR